MIVQRMSIPAGGEVVKIELVCSDFDSEFSVRYTNKCSPGCEEGMKLFFTPRLHGSTIHANICAGRHEFVSKLSKEWWARVAASVLGWDEEKIREQTDPVWAAKRNAALRQNKGTGKVQSVNKSGPTCISCGKPVRRGHDLCANCAETDIDPNFDYGSLDEL